MYAIGQTLEDKEIADRVFLNNMLRLIETRTCCGLLKRLRGQRASLYFNAVHVFGGPAYWAGKNKSDEVRMVFP